MSNQNPKVCGDLLASRWNAFVFVSYMVLFINQGILVTSTKTADNKYNYSTITVVLLTEVIKLIISIVIYSKDHAVTKIASEVTDNFKVLLLYFVPAFLYCLYNNLAFVSLASFDPTTYYLLLQFRVVVTGIVYQVLFKRKLSRSQWFSLILLTFGCVVKQMGGLQNQQKDASFLNANLILILVQVFCSCFAGVYNEYLLKDTGSQVHVMVQNVFMYIDSIVCNLFILTLTGELQRLSEVSESAIILSDPKILSVMINNALCGIVTSVFLKNLNSILKTFASALELVFTAIFCWMIFGIPIDGFTIVAIVIVSYATYRYSKNPVVNQNKSGGDLDGYSLLKNDDQSKLNELTNSRKNTVMHV